MNDSGAVSSSTQLTHMYKQSMSACPSETRLDFHANLYGVRFVMAMIALEAKALRQQKDKDMDDTTCSWKNERESGRMAGGASATAAVKV